MRTFVKHNPAAPPRFFAGEAAGLQWLSTSGGARCATVLDFDDTSLTLEYVESGSPGAGAARILGRRLAATHDAGAPSFGAPPDGWTGPGYFGPLQQPLPMSYAEHASWGPFYAQERLSPMLERARPQLDHSTAGNIEIIMKRCNAGQFEDGETPARIHGDLWSGNVMWTDDEVVLIDPAAHGGHRETDLAMLHLFGCPHLDAVIDGYRDVHALAAGWRSRIGLHQLYPLLAHVVLFGGSYRGQVARAAQLTLEIS
ncbi:MAG: fructosamine kinase family protein [Mycobacterium sp.]